MQGDTTTRPEAYLDLGNEFSWAGLKSRPSTLGLWGKHRIVFNPQVIPLEGKGFVKNFKNLIESL